MPKSFEDCIKNGGKVRTKKLGNNKYMKICYLNGKSYPGEAHTKKEQITCLKWIKK